MGLFLPRLPPVAYKVADAAIVGPFLHRVKVAGRKFVHAAMIGDALAADTVARASGIAADATSRVFLLIYTIHMFSNNCCDAKRFMERFEKRS